MTNKRMRPALVAIALLGAFLFLASCPSQPDIRESPGKVKFGTIDNASDNKIRLLNYLSDQYGKKIISGQMDTAWAGNDTNDMIARVYNDTGKYPAIKGFDMMELPYSWTNYGRQQIDEAIEWWDGKNNNVKLLPGKPDIHGIVTFCWHWRVTGNQFYTNQTDFRIPWKNNQLDTESVDFKTLIADMDKAAALLKLLKDKDIPVLWRPLHEASGNYQYGQVGWFWWGASGPKPYIALWEYMHDYFTNTKQLDNLIWVWNGQHKDWFPNPSTVDIVGYDRYTDSSTPNSAQNYSSQASYFDMTLNMVPKKDRIVALTENGAIPDPDNCAKDEAMWSWFCTWNDDQNNAWAANNSTSTAQKGAFWSGEYHNTNKHKKKVYGHSKVITLDELPDLTKYGD